jgi:hypothetical protein
MRAKSLLHSRLGQTPANVEEYYAEPLQKPLQCGWREVVVNSKGQKLAGVAELADARDSKSRALH